MTDQQTVFADTEYLTRDQICEVLKISRHTLWTLEKRKLAPPSVRIGGSVRYPKSLFDEFLRNSVQGGCENHV